jgi:hypothetical protein
MADKNNGEALTAYIISLTREGRARGQMLRRRLGSPGRGQRGPAFGKPRPDLISADDMLIESDSPAPSLEGYRRVGCRVGGEFRPDPA